MGQIVLMFVGCAVFYYIALAAGITSVAAVAATGHRLRRWAHQIDVDWISWGAICLFICLLKAAASLFGSGAVLLLIFGPMLALAASVWIAGAVSMVRK